MNLAGIVRGSGGGATWTTSMGATTPQQELRIGNAVVTEKLIEACHDTTEFVDLLRRNDPHFAELWTAFQAAKRLES